MRRGWRKPGGPSGPSVVIIGGGFAGLSALNALASAPVAVTLVDRNVYSTFQPLLYQVATAGLTSTDVAYPLWSVDPQDRRAVPQGRAGRGRHRGAEGPAGRRRASWATTT